MGALNKVFHSTAAKVALMIIALFIVLAAAAGCNTKTALKHAKVNKTASAAKAKAKVHKVAKSKVVKPAVIKKKETIVGKDKKDTKTDTTKDNNTKK